MENIALTLENLESAFRRVAIERPAVTAAQVKEHLISNGWNNLWQAHRALENSNWYRVKDAIKGKPGHQKQLRALLRLPKNPHPHAPARKEYLL